MADEDTLVDGPEFVGLHTLDTGPARARLLVESVYRWPQHALGDERSCWRRSDETVLAEVHTLLELRAGERFVRVRVELDNRARDHRLRAHVPLPAPVTASHAECAFAVVERGLTAEGGPHERALPTFVSRRFVDCSDGEVGLALLHDGLLEYEVVEDGAEVALTLLRATGYLSRAEPALRPNPAGPLDPLDGPQLQGRHVVEYALLPHRGDWRDAGLHAAADDFLVPLERVRGGGWPGAWRPRSGHVLTVDGAEVSAVLREPEGLVVRLVNPSAEPVTASVAVGDAPAAGRVVDLRDKAVGTFTGAIELRPFEIVTLRPDETT